MRRLTLSIERNRRPREDRARPRLCDLEVTERAERCVGKPVGVADLCGRSNQRRTRGVDGLARRRLITTAMTEQSGPVERAGPRRSRAAVVTLDARRQAALLAASMAVLPSDARAAPSVRDYDQLLTRRPVQAARS